VKVEQSEKQKSARSDQKTEPDNESGETETNKGVQQVSSKNKKYAKAFDVFW